MQVVGGASSGAADLLYAPGAASRCVDSTNWCPCKGLFCWLTGIGAVLLHIVTPTLALSVTAFQDCVEVYRSSRPLIVERS